MITQPGVRNHNHDPLLIKKSRGINLIGIFYFFGFLIVSSVFFAVTLIDRQGHSLIRIIFLATLSRILSVSFIVGIIYKCKKTFHPNTKLEISKQDVIYYFLKKEKHIIIPFILIDNLSICKVDTEESDHEYGKQKVRYVYLNIKFNTNHPYFNEFREKNHSHFYSFKDITLQLSINNIALFKTKILERYLEKIT